VAKPLSADGAIDRVPIQYMLARTRFVDATHYYSTLFHELIHTITSSAPSVGTITNSPVTIPAGYTVPQANLPTFQPAGDGTSIGSQIQDQHESVIRTINREKFHRRFSCLHGRHNSLLWDGMIW
jgi:hypothetical protein